jgi:hypothetical protein
MKNNFLFTSHPWFMVGAGSHKACFLTHTSFGFSTLESQNVYILSPSMNLSLSLSIKGIPLETQSDLNNYGHYFNLGEH